MTCEGYETRLTWGAPSNARETPKAGVLLNPVRLSRPQQKSIRRRAENADANSSETFADSAIEADQGSSPDCGLDFLQLQYGPSTPSSIQTPDEAVSKRLMDDFIATGHLTLTGRTGSVNFFRRDVIPLCDDCEPLRHACLAYQASLEDEGKRITPTYMQLALSGYLQDLATPEKLQLDATLAAGVLLCSVSISAMYIWTPLLRGLREVLDHRGLLCSSPRPQLADHLLEVVGLLDIPYLTINRLSKPLDIWKTYVAPHRVSGIDETSGLPFTLVNLFADLESPDAEKRLWDWPGEAGDEFIQIHLWEAFRAAGIIHSRALQSSAAPEEVDVDTTRGATKPREDTLIMKIFASIQAIVDSGAFTFRQPLAEAMLYPLFIGSLFIRDNVPQRKLARVAFHYMMDNTESRTNHVAWDIIIEVWDRAKSRVGVNRLELAAEFAAELNVELYLY